MWSISVDGGGGGRTSLNPVSSPKPMKSCSKVCICYSRIPWTIPAYDMYMCIIMSVHHYNCCAGFLVRVWLFLQQGILFGFSFTSGIF